MNQPIRSEQKKVGAPKSNFDLWVGAVIQQKGVGLARGNNIARAVRAYMCAFTHAVTTALATAAAMMTTKVSCV